MVGDNTFVGSGTFVAIGNPFNTFSSIGGEVGVVRGSEREIVGRLHVIHESVCMYVCIYLYDQGGLVWNGAGISVFIGCPVFDCVGIWSVFMAGEYYSVGGKIE